MISGGGGGANHLPPLTQIIAHIVVIRDVHNFGLA